MPFEVFEDKKNKKFYLKKEDGTMVNKTFNSLQSAINMGKQFIRYREKVDSKVIDNKKIIPKKAPMEVQSVLFEKEKFTLQKAKDWLKKHNYKLTFYGKGVDETKNMYRFRQVAPTRFDKKSYRIKELGDGVKLVLGKKEK